MSHLSLHEERIISSTKSLCHITKYHKINKKISRSCLSHFYKRQCESGKSTTKKDEKEEKKTRERKTRNLGLLVLGDELEKFFERLNIRTSHLKKSKGV